MASTKTKLTEKRNSLSEKEAHLQKFIAHKKTLIQSSISNENTIENAIRTSVKAAIWRIKEKEDKLLEELSNLSKGQRNELKVKLKTDEVEADGLTKDLKEIDMALMAEDESLMVRWLERVEQKQMGKDGTWQDGDGNIADRPEELQMRFKWDESKLNNFLDSLRLVNVALSLEHPFRIVDSRPVKMKGDVDDPWPSDVEVLEVDDVEAVIVCDSHNSALKTFYRKFNQNWESRLFLEGNPWSLAQVKTNAIAVTVPEKRKIFTVVAVPEMRIVSSFTTKKKYWGISDLSPTTIAVSCCDPPSVDILDKSGTVIRSLSPRIDDQLVLKGPYFIAKALNGNILVSDFGAKSVLGLTPLGDVQFKFSPRSRSLVTPRGLAVTTSGEILLTDVTRRGILHLTDSGKFVKMLGISREEIHPHGVAVDKYGRLYIADCNERTIQILE